MCRSTIPLRARFARSMKRTPARPGTAASRISASITRSRKTRTAWHRRLHTPERQHRACSLARGGIDDKHTSAPIRAILYYGSITAYYAVKSQVIVEAVTDIEIRSGRCRRRAAGLYSACRTAGCRLQRRNARRAWRSTSAPPLNGRAGDLLSGPKQYRSRCIQRSGTCNP